MALVNTGLTMPTDDCYVAFSLTSEWDGAGIFLVQQGSGTGEFRIQTANADAAVPRISADAGDTVVLGDSDMVGNRSFVARTGATINHYINGVLDDGDGGFPADLIDNANVFVNDTYVDLHTVEVGSLTDEAAQAVADYEDWLSGPRRAGRPLIVGGRGVLGGPML